MDEDEEGNYQDSGNMTCKLTGTYIGPLDIDVYVSDGFGHLTSKFQLRRRVAPSGSFIDMGQVFAFNDLFEFIYFWYFLKAFNILFEKDYLKGGIATFEIMLWSMFW